MDQIQATFLDQNWNQFCKLVHVHNNLRINLEKQSLLQKLELAHLNNVKLQHGSKTYTLELLRLLAYKDPGCQIIITALENQNEAILFLKETLKPKDEIDHLKINIEDGSRQQRTLQHKWPYSNGIQYEAAPQNPKRSRTQTDSSVKTDYYTNCPCGQLFGVKVPHTKYIYHCHPFHSANNLLGQGGSGKVWLGHDKDDVNSKVAVKVVVKSSNDTSTAELDMAKENWDNQHDQTSNNIVPIKGMHSTENEYWILMELANTTLTKALKENLYDINTDMKLLTKLLNDCAKGVFWLHLNGKVHRDIKPQNILLYEYRKSNNLVAKIGDFGIYRIEGANTSAQGERDWMSPEALIALEKKEKFENCKSMDIFSLGMVYYYCLSRGHPPFKNELAVKNLKLKVSPLPFEINGEISRDFRLHAARRLVNQMLEKTASKRPKISEILGHPMFWDEEKCLQFIENVSRCLNDKSTRSECMTIREKMDTGYKKHYMDLYQSEFDWKQCVDSEFFKRKQDNRSKVYKNGLSYLVELIRDKHEHHHDMLDSLKEKLFKGNNNIFSKKVYIEYFLSLFPDIVIFLFDWFSMKISTSKLCVLSDLEETYFMACLEPNNEVM